MRATLICTRCGKPFVRARHKNSVRRPFCSHECRDAFGTMRTHGNARTALYNLWVRMIVRCYNPADDAYYRYGGRGITVCKRWRNSFLPFKADMGPRPPGMTLDRRNNSRGYSPGNCRWATPGEQQNNRRGNVIVTVNGQRMTVTQAARKLGFNTSTFSVRLRRGWTLARAVSTPPQRRKKK